MEYQINDDVCIKNHDKGFEVYDNRNGNYIIFDEKNAVVANLILQGLSMTKVIKCIQEYFHCGKIESLKIRNSVLYLLIKGGFVKSKTKLNYKNSFLYVKSCLIEIINVCNFRCSHCYVDKNKIKYITYENIVSLAKELKRAKCNFITLTGGEIFIHKDFIKIYKYLYKQGFVINLNTNGYNLTKQILDCLSKYKPYSIEVSLYGYDETSYSEFTGIKNSFCTVDKNIEMLINKGIDVKTKSIISNLNKSYFDKIKAYSKKFNNSFRSDYLIFPQMGKCQKINPQQISVPEIISYLSKQNNAGKKFLKIFSQTKQNDRIFKCKQNDDSLFIDSSLHVCMCVCLQNEYQVYKKGNLLECVYNLQKIKTRLYSKKAKCRNCPYISLCRYCPAKFYLSTGSYEIPSNFYCELGVEIYNKFVKGFKFHHEKFLSEYQLDLCFEIIKDNMIELGYNVTENDGKIWKNNVYTNAQNENNDFIIIYNNGKICGFVIIEKGEKVFINEVQLSKQVKNTRLILEIIKYIFYYPSYQQFNEIYFNINNQNQMSKKTFTHLGGECVSSSEKSSQYKLTRDKVQQYLQKLLK